MCQVDKAITRRVYVGACPLDCVSQTELVGELIGAIEAVCKQLVSGVNALMYVRASEDPKYCALLENMTVVTCDGFWLTLAARFFGHRGVKHIAIVPLVFELLQELSVRKKRVFLLGAKPELVTKAGQTVSHRFPGVEVVGTRDGYFTDAEESAVVAEINAAKADVVLVGISTPRREQWMTRNREVVRAPVVIGVGGLLDILAGATREGPAWLRKIGFMWLFRLLMEPRRMLVRYLVGNVRFAYLLAKEYARMATASEKARPSLRGVSSLPGPRDTAKPWTRR
jgi:N-acetylglucosaminyldiphosphoundecaprenol N-acetyl-beta-D-mannosaminyltransferase